ncbi:patatin-like phospholipase family protein [Marivirga harenae]|uniref:patatin-like phospholipase family protein n=1 Tax=Marivirga harenae TaxID=2010992 RepID=UPI0026E07374|nr:patatin-like phospholipase family protein [Marivirga harenae]WKV12852.1 patatin-like phospholipase family protein [Marivirga harenae]|tara:strand:+ start:24536 stop:26824 length:2289 start_codon:yes stop_codon:yes gene_type:complete
MYLYKKPLLLLVLIAFHLNIYSQKVGLVLSGGGAKGLAHVGVLKALEENEIPIDYVMGTSMGGVVGGFYAAGYSPEEIDSIARSENFQNWIDGRFPDDFNTYYFKSSPSPQWLEINLGVDSTFDTNLRPKLANDLILNFALVEYTAQANQIAGENYANLLIPFTAVGAEIFTQKSVYMDKGVLGHSLRATMSVPYVYKPVKIDGEFIFDGGIYDNFPASKLEEKFDPDIMIGVNVATKIFEDYPEDDKKLISNSLLFMIMDKVNPKDLGNSSVFIEPNTVDITGFDFNKVGAIIDSGYAEAMRKMPQILEKVERRKSREDFESLRQDFKKNIKPLKFSVFEYNNLRPDEVRFINKILNPENKLELDISEVRNNYYKLIADPYFSTVFPKITYSNEKESFAFRLTSEGEQNIRLQIGGNVASSGLSNFFMGAGYDHLNYMLFNHSTSVNIGQFYKSFHYDLKMQFPFGYQFYVTPFFHYNGWDFLKTGNFLDNRRVSPINQFDRNYGVRVGAPIFDRMKIELKSSLLRKVNEYTNRDSYVSSDTLDFNRFYGYDHQIALDYVDLNKKVFPTEGVKFGLSVSHFYGDESFEPGSTSEMGLNQVSHNWIQFAAEFEQYYPLKYGDIGFSITAKGSNIKAFSNYRATILNSPAYLPTFESQGLFLENFRAPAFLAGGLKYQINLYKDFKLRVEGHAFKPVFKWNEVGEETTRTGLIPDYHLSGMGALFYESPIGPISLSAHYYDDNSPFLLLFNIGYLMYNKKPLE